MMTQAELSIPTKKPKVSEEDVARLCQFLHGKRWVKADAIEAELKFTERKIRAIAECSDGKILSGPGTPGYMLFTRATEISEADLCASQIESQAKKMLLRAGSIRRRYHRYARLAGAATS